MRLPCARRSWRRRPQGAKIDVVKTALRAPRIAERGKVQSKHIGTGKDRRVIISWHKDQPARETDAAKETKDPKPETGGASAPTS